MCEDLVYQLVVTQSAALRCCLRSFFFHIGSTCTLNEFSDNWVPFRYTHPFTYPDHLYYDRKYAINGKSQAILKRTRTMSHPNQTRQAPAVEAAHLRKPIS